MNVLVPYGVNKGGFRDIILSFRTCLSASGGIRNLDLNTEANVLR